MVVELATGVSWVGIVDWGLRRFHGYELSTHRGSSYNSYLIQDEKTVLVDTVWDQFTEEFIANLRSAVDLAKIDYIVVNHAEPDHSGALPAVMRLCPNATLVVSKRGAQSVPGHYHQNWNTKVVAHGERLSIGRRELVFLEASMLHWPDTMFTYVTGDNILMSNDAFGQHYAAPFRFNDLVDQDELAYEALKYYANILTPFSKQVAAKIAELAGLNLPVSIIAPSHGIIWRKDPMRIVHKYAQWAAQKPERYAVVIYETMWNATRKMAEAIGDGLRDQGVPFKLLYASATDRNDALVDVFRAKAVAVGSSAHNNGLLAGIMPILEDIRGLKLENKVGAAFGSFGWSGENVRLLEEHLTKAKIPLAAPGVLAKWQPTAEDLEKCRALGRAMGEACVKQEPVAGSQ